MIPDLKRRHLDAVARRELLATLGAGPWCWPVENDAEAWHNAYALVPGGPPAVAPGTVTLVTADGSLDRSPSAASLWVLRFDSGSANAKDSVRLEADALRAWEDAATALPRSLPVLWVPVKAARDEPRRVQHLVTLQLGSTPVPRPAELRGRSFGLSFVLLMASKVFGVPVPADVIASATVDADGNVGEVEGLREKIAAIEQRAPRISRLLVASGQAEEAKTLAAHLEVIPVKSAARAVEYVFGDALVGFLTRAGSQKGKPLRTRGFLLPLGPARTRRCD